MRAQEDSALLFLALFLATSVSSKRFQGVLEQVRRRAGGDLALWCRRPRVE